MDAIEASYIAFRRRLRSIDQATSCDCNSCNLAPGLDLKLFVHHGSYVRTRIAGHDELAGKDIIIVHRLLKGTTAAAARASGFALFTAGAVEALGLQPTALGLAEATEAIDQLGQVSTFTLDLEPVWQAETGYVALTSHVAARSLTSPPPSQRSLGRLGPPDLAVASNRVGGAARHRGNLAGRSAWGRNHCPMRYGSARDDRGGRGLAAIRSYRLALRRSLGWTGRGYRRPQDRQGGTRLRLRWTHASEAVADTSHSAIAGRSRGRAHAAVSDHSGRTWLRAQSRYSQLRN